LYINKINTYFIVSSLDSFFGFNVNLMEIA
jgi:hypothetical protein